MMWPRRNDSAPTTCSERHLRFGGRLPGEQLGRVEFGGGIGEQPLYGLLSRRRAVGSIAGSLEIASRLRRT
jgi:hypothetical protein